VTLIDTLRKKALEAMKAKDTVAATILRLAQSEVAAAELRANKALTGEEGFAVLRKLVKSNEETLAATTGDAERAATLTRENQVLTELLPKGLSAAEIEALLAPVADAIRAAPSDGQATGVAMKHLKTDAYRGLSLSGSDVAVAVKALRRV
jgi:uncharacterized protein YqeY